MLDMSLFRKPAFCGVSIVAFSLSASIFAMFLYLTLYMQGILGYTPFQAGLRFLPLTLTSFFAAAIAGRLAHSVAPRLLFAVGLGGVSIGLLLMHGVQLDSTWTTLLAGFLIGGVGIGLTNPTIAQVAVGVVEPARSGMAAGINNTFRQVGIATGIAGLGAIFQARVQSKATSLLSASGIPGPKSHTIAHAIATQQGGGRGNAAIAHVARASFISAFNEILLVATLVAAAGALAGALLVRSSDFAHGTAEPERVAEPAAA
jgi:predicted MFS family arabinose efflux permease